MTDHTYLLTEAEKHAVEDLRIHLGSIDSDECCDDLLLGPIPVISEDGTELLGFMKQGDDLEWNFTRDLAEAMSPLPLMRAELPEDDCE